MFALPSRFLVPVSYVKSSEVRYNLTEDLTAHSFAERYYAVNSRVIWKSDKQSVSAKAIYKTSSACGFGGFFFTNVLHQVIRSDVSDSYFVKQNMHRHPSRPGKSRKERIGM